MTSSDLNLRQTPLTQEHERAGARMVEFADYQMPVMYRSILEEVRAVRSRCGIFDISHMGRFRIEGESATAALNGLLSANVGTLEPGKAAYALLTSPTGGIIDDVILYRMDPTSFYLVVNASNRDKDREWLLRNGVPGNGVTFCDESDETAMIAVQGPDAVDILARVLGDRTLASISRFGFERASFEGGSALCLRTGYTGEDGFEIVLSADAAPALWRALETEGALPCGLGARDTLRIEAGYPLYGHEIDDETNPVDAGLMWAVDLNKAFTGREPIAAAAAKGPNRKLMGLLVRDRTIPRQGYNVRCEGFDVGTVTSGAFSSARECGIAMAYIHEEYAVPGTPATVDVRGRCVPALVVSKKRIRTAQLPPE